MKIVVTLCLLFCFFSTCFVGAEKQESDDNVCQEPLFLNWFGPFQPTGGSNEDSNSPLTFLHGLWFHINNMDELRDRNLAARRQIRLPPLDVFLKSFRRNEDENNENDDDDDNFDVREDEENETDENNNDNNDAKKLMNKFEKLLKMEHKHRFPQLTPIEQHLFNSDTQQYFANLLSNLAIPPEKREGEREVVPNADSEFRCHLPFLDETNNVTSSKSINRRFSIRLLGANNFAINSKNPLRSGDPQQHHHQQQRPHLPSSHIVEYGAAFRVGGGQSILTSPHEPANWLSLPVDPSRMVVVCQAFSPSQWAVPFPSGAAEFSGLCPPAKSSGVKLRIGRISGQLISKQMIEMSIRKRATDKKTKKEREGVLADLVVENNFKKSTSTRKKNAKFQVGYRLSKSQWSERIQEMDQVWVTSARFKNVLDGMTKITKNRDSSKVKVIPEPIDTELWRRDDRFFTEAYQKVYKNDTKKISSALWRSLQHFDVFNETHAAKMNRNLELLSRLSMLNPSFLQQEKMQSSFQHYLSFLNSTHLNRSVVFAFPTQVHNVAPRQSLVHQYFFYEAADAPEMFSSWKDETFRHLTGYSNIENKPRIFTSIFAWNSHSGFDNLLRTFVESFGGGRNENETSPVLILRTAGVSNEEFALDIPRTLDLFIEMMYAPNISNVFINTISYQDSYQAEKYYIDLLSTTKQAELFEEDKIKAKRQENEWMQEFLELYGGKLTAEQRKVGLKRVPVADRSLALRLALFQRKKMEMELLLAKKINNTNYFTQLCNKFLHQLQDPEEFDCEKIQQDVTGESWRSFMRRRLMLQNSSIEGTSFNLIQKRRNTRSRAQKQQEVTSLPTRPHVLVLLSSTSSSADASHFQHSRSIGLDLEKFRVLIASSDVIVSAARGDASAEGENLRQFQEAASLAVPVMSPVAAASVVLGNKKKIHLEEQDDDEQLVNANRSFTVPFDFVRDRFFANKFEAEVNSPIIMVNEDLEDRNTFWFEPSTNTLSSQLVKLSNTSDEMSIEMLKKGLSSRKFLVEKHDSFVVAKLVLDSIHDLVN